MKAKVVTGIVLTLLFIGMLTFVSNIQPVKASEPIIYIRANGSIDPPTANITSADNITYTLIANIFNQSIFVERDNIVIDGAGRTLQGTGIQAGVVSSERSNVTIQNITITACWAGIIINGSSGSTISGNTITNNDEGIRVSASINNNIVSWNNITNNSESGIVLFWASNTTVYGNNITNNNYGVKLEESHSFNMFCYNNFVDNTQQVNINPAYQNFWNLSYPLGGNYWSNYTGVDEKNGPNQDQPGCDGYGDTPHVIKGNNQDNYPLMHPFTAPIETTVTWNDQVYPVTTVSNTTIGPIEQHGQHTLRFTATGEGEMGYIFFITPKFTDSEPIVKINGHNPPDPFPTINDNGTHWFIYFEFPLSTNIVDIYFPGPVGGISIPVDKLSLLAPYLALIATIILAASISVAYIKYRKK